METRAPLYLKEIIDELLYEKKISSLRTFSTVAKVSASQISLILSGKRFLSKSVATKIVSNVKLNQVQTKNLLMYVESDKKIIRLKKKEDQKRKISFQKMESDENLIIGQWQHSAILSLVETEGFRCAPTYIAKRLGISETNAAQSLERLFAHKLLIKNGTKVVCSSKQFTTTCDIPSQTIRNYHKENLSLAHTAIENIPVDERDFSGFFFAFDTKKLKEAKEELKRFRRKFALKFETNRYASDVYLLNLQFFPISKKDK